MNNEPLLNVKCFLLDMDGTFNLGDELIDGSLYFIMTLSELGRDFLFLTNNSSKHRGLYAEKDQPPRVADHGGQGLHLRRSHRTVPAEGTSRRADLCGRHPRTGGGVSPAWLPPDDHDPEMVVLGFDTTLTYEKLWKLCDLVRMGLPYIATHPDFNCPTETGYMPDIGAMIAFVRASTGREPDLVVGKPNRMIVDAVSQKLGLPIDEMAMVGDRLYTDIALGANSGITTCLVLSGETAPRTWPTLRFSRPTPSRIWGPSRTGSGNIKAKAAPMTPAHAVVIGAGSTGAAIAHDLALRGLRVTLVERFGPAAGTTGHNQAQLHSGRALRRHRPRVGARVHRGEPHPADTDARLPGTQRWIVHRPRRKRIWPTARVSGGLRAVRHPCAGTDSRRALQLEPRLNPHLLTAIRIPDGVFDPYRFTLQFIATALKAGREVPSLH